MAETDFLIEILRKLIASDTTNPPGNEKNLARVIQELLRDHGIPSRIDDLGDNRANLIAEIAGGAAGPVLALNGHLDTVPVRGDWSVDPFAGMVVEGCLVGAGAVDMKGAIASMIAAVIETAALAPARLKGKLILACVADEERGGRGTLDFLRRYPAPRYVVVGEPSNLNLVTSNRGVIRLRISTHGVAGHCSKPAAGINAIYHMAEVVGRLKAYADRLSAGDGDYHEKPSLSVTTIRGGTSENVIPDACEITVDRRMLHSESMDAVEAQIVDILEQAGGADATLRYSWRRFEQMPPWKLNPDSMLLRHCRSAYEKCFRRPPVPKDLGGTSEAGLFAAAGSEVVIFGPGDIAQAHSRDERLEIEQLAKAAEFYRLLIAETLMDGAGESGRK